MPPAQHFCRHLLQARGEGLCDELGSVALEYDPQIVQLLISLGDELGLVEGEGGGGRAQQRRLAVDEEQVPHAQGGFQVEGVEVGAQEPGCCLLHNMNDKKPTGVREGERRRATHQSAS